MMLRFAMSDVAERPYDVAVVRLLKDARVLGEIPSSQYSEEVEYTPVEGVFVRLESYNDGFLSIGASSGMLDGEVSLTPAEARRIAALLLVAANAIEPDGIVRRP